MPRPLTDFEKERARAWMRDLRGETPQHILAAAITETIDWTITRDRYSKYESGAIDFGRGVLDKFIAYWAKKGMPGPDFTPPVTTLPPVDLPTALMALASANEALANELQASREERLALAARVEELDLVLRNHVAQTIANGEAHRAPPETTGSAGK